MIASNPIEEREPLTCPTCGDYLREVHAYSIETWTFNERAGIYSYDGSYQARIAPRGLQLSGDEVR